MMRVQQLWWYLWIEHCNKMIIWCLRVILGVLNSTHFKNCTFLPKQPDLWASFEGKLQHFPQRTAAACAVPGPQQSWNSNVTHRDSQKQGRKWQTAGFKQRQWPSHSTFTAQGQQEDGALMEYLFSTWSSGVSSLVWCVQWLDMGCFSGSREVLFWSSEFQEHWLTVTGPSALVTAVFTIFPQGSRTWPPNSAELSQHLWEVLDMHVQSMEALVPPLRVCWSAYPDRSELFWHQMGAWGQQNRRQMGITLLLMGVEPQATEQVCKSHLCGPNNTRPTIKHSHEGTFPPWERKWGRSKIIMRHCNNPRVVKDGPSTRLLQSTPHLAHSLTNGLLTSPHRTGAGRPPTPALWRYHETSRSSPYEALENRWASSYYCPRKQW